MQDEFVIYSGAGCTYCEQAKKLLDSKELPYSVIDAKSSLYFRKEFIDKGIRKIPQIFIEDHYIGGFDELVSYLSTRSN
jgi:glutaredoxin 3